MLALEYENGNCITPQTSLGILRACITLGIHRVVICTYQALH